MGNSSSFKFNNAKKEDPYEEIYYGPDPSCYLLNTNCSVSLSRKKTLNDGNPYEEIYYGPDHLLNTKHSVSLSRKNPPINDGNSRFKSRSIPPIPRHDKTDALSCYSNYYNTIGVTEVRNRNSIAMVPKEQVFNIKVIVESKNASRRPSVSTVLTDSMPSSRRNSIVKTENRPTELNFEELISSEDMHVMHFTGFLADV